MFRKKFLIFVSFIFVCGLLIVGCSSEETAKSEEDGLFITTSFSVLGDIISQVTKERATVNYIVPVGEEPHEYEPTPGDFSRISDSSVFYVNGLDLEEWLEKVISNISDTDIVTLSDGVTEIPLVGNNEADPHAWLSPKNVIIYVENLVEDLIKRDPEGELIYRENAEAYIAELLELDNWIVEQFEQIPVEHRVIIVSENAFKYFGKDYGFHTEGIWDINSLEEGTPQQYARLSDFVRENNVPALFVESTIDKRYMEMISNETGVAIAGEVYTDAVGEEGSGAENYIGMMKENVKVFVEGLKN
ncbi:metal ABC transporter substrate-binding protein [Anaerobacillus alkalidiazotrophicus]|uniref:Metal ABC transporter substrate-binding protein n=1 Tax=Anaerobacillus alkalidiazotrophicus TaxID=472963 RepID=A0A1S2M7C7_9BACI|nr:metal ABC transporter substrate-binding protein [Anaerobacillus alkalidiazotrophicus]OIJ18106.1 metal ABC transporter substrate-binding protein [Anaerobacillus alkalidiazotrophicus]OIJ19585.1 metal ABC transporter substrate-binding protein [Anaerobacillus alkalidiazotrophicus]